MSGQNETRTRAVGGGSGTWPIVRAGVRILIVDDDPSASAGLSRLMAAEGYETTTASDGRSGLAAAKRWSPALIITDLMMPGMDGIELCRRIHALDPDLPVIVTTGVDQSEAGLECLQAGAEDYLSKPLQVEAVAWSVQRALQRRADKREGDRLRVSTDALCDELRIINERLVVSSIRVQELADSEKRQRAELNALLEGLGEGIIIIEASGHLRMINEAACAILGVDHVSTVDMLDALEPHDLHGAELRDAERPFRRALRGEDFSDYEVAYLLPNGQQRRVVMTATSVKDAAGAVAVAIVVLRDVTQLRRLERQREEYTALISHDLRNPLNVISMSAGLLHESLTQKQLTDDLDYVTRIDRNARQMAGMLEDLTEASRLESQETAPQRTPSELGRLVGDVVGRLDEARRRRIAIEAEVDGGYFVLADAAQIDRCITNLITNALKYSDEGAPVFVRLARRASCVELAVVDYGIGIAPENVERIFDRYFRTASGRRQAEGMGLGLYIVRLVVEAHGGRVDVVSELGVGSTFQVTLPLLIA